MENSLFRRLEWEYMGGLVFENAPYGEGWREVKSARERIAGNK